MLKKALALTIALFTTCASTIHAQTLIKGFNGSDSPLRNCTAKAGNLVLFVTDDGVNGSELWKTDGTATGTALLKDINPGAKSSYISSLVTAGSKIYFSADDGVNGKELWVSDGTTAGTYMLKDINANYDYAHGSVGDAPSSSNPSNIVTCNDKVFFIAASPLKDIWMSDGTATGTVKLTQATVNTNSEVSELVSAGDAVYFTVNNTGLYKANVQGTITPVSANMSGHAYIGTLRSAGNGIAFVTQPTVNDRSAVRIYSCGADGNAVLLQNIPGAQLGNVAQAGALLYFDVSLDQYGSNYRDVLFCSDGTSTGTIQLRSFSITSGSSSDLMNGITAFNSKAYFIAPITGQLYASNGTVAGTAIVADSRFNELLTVPEQQKLFLASFYDSQYSVYRLYSYNGSTLKAESQYNEALNDLYNAGGTVYLTTKKYASGTAPVSKWTNAAAPQLSVQSGTKPVLNGTELKFNIQPNSSITEYLSVVNTGNKDLVLNEISVLGNSFYINTDVQPKRTLAPGEKMNLRVYYYPLKEEQVSGSLLIKSNDNSGYQYYTINLTGNAASTSSSGYAANLADGLLKSIVFRDDDAGFLLSSTAVAEKAPVGTLIGAFTINEAQAYTYSLVTGMGDADNSSFSIDKGSLKTTQSFDYAIKNTYTVRVKAAPATGAGTEKSFTVQVTNTQNNLAPACGMVFKSIQYTLNNAVYAGSRIVAVGNAGTIMVSDDDGQNWKLVNAGITDDLLRLNFTDARTGHIVSRNGLILRTENGGDSWFPISSGAANSYYGNKHMFFCSTQSGYILRSDTLFKTTDGGRSIQPSAKLSGYLDAPMWFTSMDNGFVSNGQELLHIINGTRFEKAEIPFKLSSAIKDIVFVDNKNGFLLGDQGELFQTKDSGNSWQSLTTIDAVTTQKLYFVDKNNGYIIANTIGSNSSLPVLLKTVDGGKSWQTEFTGTVPFTALALNANGTQLCLIGYGGKESPYGVLGESIYLKSGGKAWTKRSYLGTDDYTGSFADKDVIYLFGVRNLKSTDRGFTWQDINTRMDGAGVYYKRKTFFLNKNVGYTSFYDGKGGLFKTTDGGANWMELKSPTQYSLFSGIYFADEHFGLISDDDGNSAVSLTYDGGLSWQSTVQNGYGIAGQTYSFPNAQTGYVANGNDIFKTTDRGVTWTHSAFDYNYKIHALYFTDAQTGLAGGNAGLLLRTNDGGQHWNIIKTSTIAQINSFEFADAMHGYFLTAGYNDSRSIYETNDGGLTWNSIYEKYPSGINTICITNGELIAAGKAGVLYKLTTAAGPANAGYISGDVDAVSANKTLYSTIAIPDTYYRWSTSDPADIEYLNNKVIVTWKQAGKHALQVNSYNNCSNGEGQSLTVNVQEMPAPEITGTDAVLHNTSNVTYTTPDHGNGLEWVINGGSFMATTNQANVNWGNAGTGKVTVFETNTHLNLKKSASLEVAILNDPLKLPANNFSVQVTSATCKGSNNGLISISAAQELNYNATVTGGSYNKSFTFTKSAFTNNLAPGNYTIMLTVAGYPDFKRSYTAVITEPQDLSLYTTVNPDTRTVTLSLAGAAAYHVELDGKTYETTATQLTLPLSNSVSKLKVYSDKLCQGVIEKHINLNKIMLYPNPFVDRITINIGGSVEAKAGIQISNLYGKILYQQEQPIQEGLINISVNSFESGVYVLRLTLDNTSSVFKIMKR